MAASGPLPVATTPSGTAFVDSGGSGPTVVLVHGVGLSHAMWSAQIAALSSSRYRVIAPDMLGHGASTLPSADATLDDYAEAIVGLLDHLRIDCAIIVGFSMGALVARALVARHPARVAAMVLLNGVFGRPDEARRAVLDRVMEAEALGPSANVDAALDRWFSPAYAEAHPEVIDTVRAQVIGTDAAAYATSYRLFATGDDHAAEHLSRIAVPVLVATGELDVGSTPAMSEALAAAIPGARLAVLADARHMMPIERAAEVDRMLLSFLAEIASHPHP